MKFPRNIKVDGYDEVTVAHGDFTVSITVDDGDESLELALYVRESRALRKALKAAEALVVNPLYRPELSV